MENDSRPDDGAPPPSAAEARAALAGLDRDSARLAERLETPAWYHPVLGLIVAAFVAAQAVPGPLSMIVLAIGAALLAVLVIVYRRLYGISTTQTGGRRSRRTLLLAAGIFIATMLASTMIKLAELPLWWALLPAAIAFTAAVVLGRRYDEALRIDLSVSGDGRS